MKNLNIKKIEALGTIFMILAGSLLHFVYAWSGQNWFVGILSAVNESVWEHSKLFILPLVIVGFVEYILVKDATKVLWAKLVEFTMMSVFITAFFYTYTGSLGIKEILIIDITSFIVAVILGQFISYKILTSKAKVPVGKYLSGAALLLIFATFTCFTFYPPELPIFEAHENPEE